MSKTVKRAMTVMMIGLVAMLGAKVEAHWVIVKGRCVWHSFECYRQDTEVPDPIPILFPPLVELVARPSKLEVLCTLAGPPLIIDLKDYPSLATLRTPIDRGDYTERRAPTGRTRFLEVRRILSDAPFAEDTSLCKGVSPIDVIVRIWSSVEMNLYLNIAQSVPHSAWRAETCTLVDGFNLTEYPKNFPPRGALYECKTITPPCHGNCPRP